MRSRIPKRSPSCSTTILRWSAGAARAAGSRLTAQYGPGNYIPPVTLTFWSFRIMVGAGFLMLLLAFLAVIRPKVKFLQKSRLFLKILIPAMAAPLYCQHIRAGS